MVDSAELAATASAFLDAMRWGDIEAASGFVEGEGKKAFYKTWLVHPPMRVTEASLIEATTNNNQGTTLVKLEGFSGQIVSTNLVELNWYKMEDAWYVSVESVDLSP